MTVPTMVHQDKGTATGNTTYSISAAPAIWQVNDFQVIWVSGHASFFAGSLGVGTTSSSFPAPAGWTVVGSWASTHSGTAIFSRRLTSADLSPAISLVATDRSGFVLRTYRNAGSISIADTASATTGSGSLNVVFGTKVIASDEMVERWVSSAHSNAGSGSTIILGSDVTLSHSGTMSNAWFGPTVVGTIPLVGATAPANTFISNCSEVTYPLMGNAVLVGQLYASATLAESAPATDVATWNTKKGTAWFQPVPDSAPAVDTVTGLKAKKYTLGLPVERTRMALSSRLDFTGLVAGNIPAEITRYSYQQGDDYAGNPPPSITGPATYTGLWQFNSSKWYTTGNFDYSCDVYLGQNSDGFFDSFWLNGMTPSFTGMGFNFLVRNGTSAPQSGFYFGQSGQGHNYLLPSTAVIGAGGVANTYIAIAYNDWHRIRLQMNGTVVTATVTKLSNSTVVIQASCDVGSFMATTAGPSFGYVQGGYFGTQYYSFSDWHNLDNFALDVVATDHLITACKPETRTFDIQRAPWQTVDNPFTGAASATAALADASDSSYVTVANTTETYVDTSIYGIISQHMYLNIVSATQLPVTVTVRARLATTSRTDVALYLMIENQTLARSVFVPTSTPLPSDHSWVTRVFDISAITLTGGGGPPLSDSFADGTIFMATGADSSAVGPTYTVDVSSVVVSTLQPFSTLGVPTETDTHAALNKAKGFQLGVAINEPASEFDSILAITKKMVVASTYLQREDVTGETQVPGQGFTLTNVSPGNALVWHPSTWDGGWFCDMGVWLGGDFSTLNSFPTTLPGSAFGSDFYVLPEGDSAYLDDTGNTNFGSPRGRWRIRTGTTAYFTVGGTTPSANSHLWAVWYGPAFDPAIDPFPDQTPAQVTPSSMYQAEVAQPAEYLPHGETATQWFSWTAQAIEIGAPTSVTFSFSYNGQSGSGGASINVYSDTGAVSPGAGALLYTNAVTGATGTTSVTFTPTAGVTYTIQRGIKEATGEQSALFIAPQWAQVVYTSTPDPHQIPVRPFMKTVVSMPDPTASLVKGIPQGWHPTVTQSVAGVYVVNMWPRGGTPTDVTFFRGVPTQVESYSFLDPFTYGHAVITFPQISVFDALGTGETAFLGTEANPANVDIWFYPMVAGTQFINPMTNAKDLGYGTGQLIWEGYIASMEIQGNESGTSLQVQCQGALFQLDGYKQKPFFPRRPYILENLMFEVTYPVYSTGNQGHYFGKSALRTLPLLRRYPVGWTKVVPARKEGEPDLYTPVSVPGRMSTGYTTRNTGTWDNCLTGFIQEMLAVMYTTDDCGVTAGDQWALRCESGRQPVLEVRSRTRTPDFSVWVGTPGITISVSSDFTEIENSIYGEGTGTDGNLWRNSHLEGAWYRTDYEPLASTDQVYPDIADGNASQDVNVMVHESKTQFGAGMNMADAITSSEKRLAIVKDAGLAGTMTMQVDTAAVSRWDVRAGMTVNIKGLKGSGATGINFHIAEVIFNVNTMTAECKIDTKYRDLLTLEEARARTIDPMTPSKLLQVNSRTLLVEDILAPWDYHAGSGYVPHTARYGRSKKHKGYDFFEGMPSTTQFPWESWTKRYPPASFDLSDDGKTRGPYIKVDANNEKTRLRWTGAPVLFAAKGAISHTQIAAYHVNGGVYKVPFHVSFYYGTGTNGGDMPHNVNNYDPLNLDNAFESQDDQGIPTTAVGTSLAPSALFIIGWGNKDQPAGYAPGQFTNGSPASGLFIEEGGWTYDCIQGNEDFDFTERGEIEGQRPEAVMCQIMCYANASSDVYFLGRLFKQEPGGNA